MDVPFEQICAFLLCECVCVCCRVFRGDSFCGVNKKQTALIFRFTAFFFTFFLLFSTSIGGWFCVCVCFFCPWHSKHTMRSCHFFWPCFFLFFKREQMFISDKKVTHDCFFSLSLRFVRNPHRVTFFFVLFFLLMRFQVRWKKKKTRRTASLSLHSVVILLHKTKSDRGKKRLLADV